MGLPTIVVIPEHKRAAAKPKEQGIRLFTVHVRRGAPDVQDPNLNSHSKLNCITACIQVGQPSLSIADHDWHCSRCIFIDMRWPTWKWELGHLSAQVELTCITATRWDILHAPAFAVLLPLEGRSSLQASSLHGCTALADLAGCHGL